MVGVKLFLSVTYPHKWEMALVLDLSSQKDFGLF